MADQPENMPLPLGRISPWALGVMCALAWGLVLAGCVGADGWSGAIMALLKGLPTAGAIFLAGGGWGYWAIRRFLPRETPAALTVATSVGVGLWLLSSVVLGVGTFFDGALTQWVWWPVVGAGLLLAMLAGRRHLEAFQFPDQLDGASVLWVVAAAAGAFWIAGATMPPGLIGRVNGDFYDVVSYHLQVPAEYYRAGRISYLAHNTYSNFPFGAEMLFLLSMALSGSVEAGVYAAKLTHGLWLALAVLAVVASVPKGQIWRRRSAGAMLACTPIAVYLSWLAFVELAELAYLAIGLAWLSRWLREPNWRAGLFVGLAAGAACAVKYLSVGFIAGPLLAVMLLGAAYRRKGLAHLVLAGVACGALFAPWLARNAAYTHNPVFPLATGVFGAGPWSDESAKMWNHAHAPLSGDAMGRQLVEAVATERGAGLLLALLAAGGAAWTLRRPRKADALEIACLAIIAMQLAVWIFATHMAGRFLCPAVVPMAILAAGFTARLSRKGAPPSGRQAQGERSGWGFVLASVLVLCALSWNLLLTWRLYEREQTMRGPAGVAISLVAYHGLSTSEFAEADPTRKRLRAYLGSSGQMLLVADIRPFLMPANTVYTSVWSPDLLVLADRQAHGDPRQIVRLLRQQGITLVWVNWGEVQRLRRTYGWWPRVTPELIDSLVTEGGAERLPIMPEDTDQSLATRPEALRIVELLRLPD